MPAINRLEWDLCQARDLMERFGEIGMLEALEDRLVDLRVEVVLQIWHALVGNEGLEWDSGVHGVEPGA
jgi:hypothetical protein